MSERLVLGLGGTVDYEIAWAPAVLEKLIDEHRIDAAELDTRIPVVDERSLLLTLLAFVRDGVGGERFVASSDIVAAFAARFPTRVTLGGTCVRAAIAMRSMGVTSLVHLVSIDDNVRRLLPDGIASICSGQRDTTDPHLIVQFPAGARVRQRDIDLAAPHPNRIIYTNDPPNRHLLLARELREALGSAQVFLVSGFNTMQDAGELDERVGQVIDHLAAMPDGSVVVFEDAGYHNEAFGRRVRDRLAPHVDVYSLNEDELAAYRGHPLELLDASAMAEALEVFAAEVDVPCLVVHSKRWSVAIGTEAWRYAAALRGGILMASTRYLVGDGHTSEDYRRTATLPPQTASVSFAAELEAHFGGLAVCLPALVLDTPSPTTIGLGDSFIGGFLAALVAGG
ncbi:hypothetical protein GCM10027416_27920 [Okibacterium endophyticum]